MTSDLVKAAWATMLNHYDSALYLKEDSWLMRIAAWGLSAFGVMDRRVFIEEYATTIGKCIYVPFMVGDFSRVSAVDQLSLCAHEHQHVVQYRAGRIRFLLGYALSSRRRALYEADALAVTMQVHHALTGVWLDVDSLSRQLKNYACTPADIAAAKEVLAKVPFGAVTTFEVAARLVSFIEGQG